MIEQAIKDLMALLPIQGAPGKEAEVAAFLRQKLIDIGIPAANIRHDNAQAQSEYGGEVGNLIVLIDGDRPGPRMLFSTHMDTVPDAVGCLPRIDLHANTIINDADALWQYMEAADARYLMAFPDQIPGDDPDDPRLCEVFTADGPASAAVDGPTMVIYRLAWDSNCSS